MLAAEWVCQRSELILQEWFSFQCRSNSTLYQRKLPVDNRTINILVMRGCNVAFVFYLSRAGFVCNRCVVFTFLYIESSVIH